MVPRDTAGIAFFPRSEFASMIVKPRIIWLWLLPGLSGCIALPSAEPGRGVVGGDSVSMAQHTSLSDRPVSRSDVIQQLGPPTIEFTDLRVSAYAWVEHQRDWTLYVPHSYLPKISTIPFENLERSILFVHWDAAERVTAIGVRGKQRHDSLRAQALAWLRSENIVADEVSAVGTEIPRTAPAAATSLGRLVIQTAEAPPHFDGWLRNVYRCQLLAVLIDDRLVAELQPRARWDMALPAGPHQLAIDPWPSHRYSPSERQSNAFNYQAQENASILPITVRAGEDTIVNVGCKRSGERMLAVAGIVIAVELQSP
jgi:hypothetical protein